MRVCQFTEIHLKKEIWSLRLKLNIQQRNGSVLPKTGTLLPNFCLLNKIKVKSVFKNEEDPRISRKLTQPHILVPADKVESMEECMLQDFDPDRHSSRGRAGRNAYDDDDDDDHAHGRGGRGGVQCESH